jgi:hypothetical protein
VADELVGRYAVETAEALTAVEAHKCAVIVRRMLAFFPDGSPSADDAVRAEHVNSLLANAQAQKVWRELGDELLGWPDDINDLLTKYVARHEADFS